MSKLIANFILFFVLYTFIIYIFSFTNFNKTLVSIIAIPLVMITVNEIIPDD